MLDISGIEFSAKDRKKKVRLPAVLDEDLAEDIGAYLGDGCINIYKRPFALETHFSCRGHPIDDKQWYDERLIPLKKKLFGIELIGRHTSDGTYGIKFGSKAIIGFYRKAIGLKLGRKQGIALPRVIMRADQRIQFACLRGLFDTDGTITFKKKYRDRHYYPRISLTSASERLIQDVDSILKNASFTTAFSGSLVYDPRSGKAYWIYRLDLNGRLNLEKWISLIGFNNFKHQSKYLVWKKYGFCSPHLTPAQREELLKRREQPVREEWTRRDLNARPLDYQSSAPTRLSYGS